jgi:PAS domain-containing protein
LYEIISRFAGSKSFFKETIQEMERDKEIIHQKNEELRAANRALYEKIIELRKSEEALRESREHFQKLLDIVPDMISIHDPEMNIVYSNWMGFGSVPQNKRILNTKCYTTYRGHDRICPDCEAVKVLKLRKPFRTERELPDGTCIDLRVIPMLDDRGDVALFMEWVRDITEAKRYEKALKESEEKYRLLFENANEAIFIAQDGMVVFSNPSPSFRVIFVLKA